MNNRAEIVSFIQEGGVAERRMSLTHRRGCWFREQLVKWAMTKDSRDAGML